MGISSGISRQFGKHLESKGFTKLLTVEDFLILNSCILTPSI